MFHTLSLINEVNFGRLYLKSKTPKNKKLYPLISTKTVILKVLTSKISLLVYNPPAQRDCTTHFWKIIPAFLIKKIEKNLIFHLNCCFNPNKIKELPTYYLDTFIKWRKYFSFFLPLAQLFLRNVYDLTNILK